MGDRYARVTILTHSKKVTEERQNLMKNIDLTLFLIMFNLNLTNDNVDRNEIIHSHHIQPDLR